MTEYSELDLMPVSGWEAPPTYFISIGGLGYLILSWLMYYVSQYLPHGMGMDQFKGARFMALDTAAGEGDDLPENDWAGSRLCRMEGDLNQIIGGDVKKGLYPGIKDFYVDTEVARRARKEVGNLKDGAGTTRPFGRIGFFYNWEKIYGDIVKLLQQKIESCQMRYGGNFQIDQGEKKKIRQFFVISSLAGGTGSSSFLDVAAALQLLRRMNYPNENWTVIGIFTLADVLASDQKVHQENHRTRMKANSYAALKELNHFMSGQPFSARYGRNGEDEIKLSNREVRDKLFDIAFLADTPNDDNQPLSGRKEVAQFLAQITLQLSLTTFNFEFFTRLVDSTANLLFRQEYPPSIQDKMGEERQQYLFSTLGLSTLDLPVNKYIEYSCYCLTEKLLEYVYKITPSSIDNRACEQIASNLGLTENSLDQVFTSTMTSVLLDIDNSMRLLREAANPIYELRSMANLLEGMHVDYIRKQAGLKGDQKFQDIFPTRGKGPLEQALERLASKGGLSRAYEALDELLGGLAEHLKRLQTELDNATSQVAAGEGPGFLNPTDSQQGILQNQNVADVLHAMEQSWNTWGDRLFRGFYRRRFVNMFEGEIGNLLESFQRFQETAFHKLVWPTKIELISKIIDALDRIQQEYKSRGEFADHLKSEIFRKKNEIIKETNQANRFQLNAIDAGKFFDDIFRHRLGNLDTLMRSIGEEIKHDGLQMPGTTPIPFAQWDEHSAENIANALFSYCKEKTLGDNFGAGKLTGNGTSLYQVGLDHDLFLPSDRPTFFGHILMDWKYRSQISLLFTGVPPEIFRCVISGCRTEGPDAWDKTLNLQGLRVLSGGRSNRATLLNLGMGFPIQSVARIKDWYEMAYISQKRQGWPLHLFSEETEDIMVEPYLEWLGIPDRHDAENLYKEAIKCRIISNLNGNIFIDDTTLKELPERIRNFFYDFYPEPISYDFSVLKDKFRDDKWLVGTLKHALLRADAPEVSNYEQWNAKKIRISQDKVDTDEILNLAQEAGLLKEENGQHYFDDSLWWDSVGGSNNFSQLFFSENPTKKTISENEFINGLLSHKPLSRWITKRVLRCLLHTSQIDETRTRLANNQFSDFLENVIIQYMG
jgi:hypothetical protein